jgi:endonuclease YncB( thermonuclease family)
MSASLRTRALFLLFLSLSTIVSCSREANNSVSGKVVSIADGDTITVLDAQYVQHRIRLQGIDAPERRQDFGAASREHLANLVFGKYVRIEFEKVDRDGRLVGKVWADGNDECLEQLKAGLAWHYKEYEREQPASDRQLYASAELEARNERRGLWKDQAPIPPWEFRHHASGSTADTDSTDQSDSADRKLMGVSPAVVPDFRNAGATANQSPANAQKPVTNIDPGVIQPNSAPHELSFIRGNRRTMIYHWPGCPNYDDIALHNRVPFQDRQEAETAGYRAARNCH